MNKNILLVDDDLNVLSGFQRTLRNRFTIEIVSSGDEALDKVRHNGSFAVIVADMQMPHMSGLDLLVKVQSLAPDTVRMMLTGNADQKTAVDAVNSGHVFRFLNKPCGAEALIQALEAGLPLTPAEQTLLARLPEIGATFLAHIPRIEPVAAIVRYQRKHYDGKGYPPDNIAGEDIPIGARILKVLHDLAQMESQSLDKAQALAALKEQPGVYDPRVLDSAFACFDVYPPKSAAGQNIIRPHTLRELTVGQVLASNVLTTDGILVASAGTQLTTIVLHRLRNFADLKPLKEPIYIQG